MLLRRLRAAIACWMETVKVEPHVPMSTWARARRKMSCSTAAPTSSPCSATKSWMGSPRAIWSIRQPTRRATLSMALSVKRRSLATSMAHRFARTAALRISPSNTSIASAPVWAASKWRMCTATRISSSSSRNEGGSISFGNANALSKTAPYAACGPNANKALVLPVERL